MNIPGAIVYWINPVRMNPRQRIKLRFKSSCATNTQCGWNDLSEDAQNEILSEIERGCYNEAIALAEESGIYCNFDNPAFISQYSLICHRVGAHLDASSLVGITPVLGRILSGELDPVSVARLKSVELYPDASAKLRDDIETRLRQDITPKTSSRYKCKKCGGTETSVREYQSRAGDEASTTSIKCIREGCGHTWRVH